jgi:hypothetical protein
LKMLFKHKLQTRIAVSVLLILFFVNSTQGQSCSTGNNNDRNFFTFCQSGSSYTLNGNYSITIGNNSELTLNGNVTINGTLTVNIQAANGQLIIPSNFTLSATNLTFSGNTGGSKVLEVEGTMSVTNTLNFGGTNMEIDGGGTITAGSITGSSNTGCADDNNCPYVYTPSCADNSSLCNNDVQDNPPLPLQLISWSVSKNNNQVEFNWVTASEVLVQKFIIEASHDAKNFYIIGEVRAKGNNNKSRTTYQYEATLESNAPKYFRLKSFDYDGSSQVYGIKALQITSNGKSQIYPNPISSAQNEIYFSSDFETNTTVQIFDASGRLVISTLLNARSFSLQLNETLKKGVYYIKIENKEAYYSGMQSLVVI